MADKITIEVDVKSNTAKVLEKDAKAVKNFEKTATKSFLSVQRIAETAFGFVTGAALVAGFNKLTNSAKRLFDVFVTQGVAAANQQEQAILDLNGALANAGQFSQETSDQIVEFAEALQRQTNVTDQAVIAGVTLAQTYVKTAEEAQFLTATAIDFAKAADLSFTEAVRRLGRGVQGAAGDLANFAPAIRNMTKEQLAAGNATRLIAKEFAGAANVTDNYVDRVKQNENAFLSLQEAIGKTIIENAQVIAIIKDSTATFDDLRAIVEENEESIKAFISAGVLVAIDGMILLAESVALNAKRLLNLAITFNKARVATLEFFNQFAISSRIAKETQKDIDDVKDTVSALQLVLGELETGTMQKLIDRTKLFREEAGKAVVTQELLNKKAGPEGEAGEELQDTETEDLKRIAAIQQRIELERQAEDEGFQARVDSQKKLLNDMLNNEKLGSTARLKVLSFENSEQKKQASNRRSSLNTIASLQTAQTKELAAVGKAAAIANATISTFEGANKAFAAFGPFGFIAAAAVITAGLANVSKIVGVGIQGGMTEVPQGFPNDTFPARLTSGERVVDAGTNEDLKAFLIQNSGQTEILSAILGSLSTQREVTVNVEGEPIFRAVQEQIESGRELG